MRTIIPVPVNLLIALAVFWAGFWFVAGWTFRDIPERQVTAPRQVDALKVLEGLR